MKKLVLIAIAALSAAAFAAAPTKPCTALNEGETRVTYSGPRKAVEETYVCSSSNWQLIRICDWRLTTPCQDL